MARALIGAIWRDNPEVRDATEVQAEELLWADAAIRVVLAEAQRSIEALPAYGAPAQGAQRIDRAEALAVLAALGEQVDAPYGVCGCGHEMDEYGCPLGH